MKKRVLKPILMGMSYTFAGFVFQLLFINVLWATETNAQNIKSIKDVIIQVEIQEKTLMETFGILERMTPFKFVYHKRDPFLNEKFTLAKQTISVEDVLIEIAKANRLKFKQINNNITVSRSVEHGEELIEVADHRVEIRGTVTDELGEPLPGVTVVVEGTSVGTVTDIDGKYVLQTEEGAVLLFSFVGYETQRRVVGSSNVIDVKMNEDTSSLDEVVVVGYGVVKKSDLTGSVAQVKAAEINAFPTSNVMQALSGRAAGVQVIQNTGAPGASISVRIRGANSIQGQNEPLYVIDGFPFSGNPTNLNNFDIESIEVLKDASATAIYGSRGANGVVLITTKQGKEGTSRVDFESSYSVQTLRRKLDLMNGREYANLQNIQAANDNLAPYFTQEQLAGFGEGFDWQDLVFRSAPILSSALNVSGGNSKTQYSIAGSFLGQEGIIQGSDYNRYSLRANVSHSISEKLKIEFNNTLSHLKTERRDSGGGQRGNSMIGAALSAAPISQPYNEDGSYNILANEFPFVAPDIINPLNFIHEQFDETKANVVLANMAFVYQPTKDLTLRISGGVENRDDRNDSYTTRRFFNSPGRANVNTNQFRSLLSENTLSYNKTIAEKHQINSVIGFTYQDFLTTSLGAGGVGFLSDAFETYRLDAAETPGIPRSRYSKAVLLSYLGRVNYTFNNKYLFTLSFRSDGSSRYSPGNKWGYFPSGAVAWRISDEEFIPSTSVISDLKLRASWGMTGSQAINPYATLNQLDPGFTIFGNQLYNTFAPSTVLPGDLRWETTEQLDVGLDIGLLNDRIIFNADYYVKNTRDLLNTVRLPSSLGFTTTIRNVGQVQNRGVEFSVDAKALTGRFKWDVFGNIAFNRNKVISLHNSEDILGAFVNVLVIGDNLTILREGRPMGQFWGFVEDGYTENGQIRFVDINGDGNITNADKTYIGDPNPKFIYGLNSNMSYQNFEFSFFIQGIHGNDIFNLSSVPSTLDYGQGMNMPREVLYNHWTPENPDAKYPRVSRNVSARVSDRFIEDGSFLRFRNIEFAYNLPVERIGAKSFRSAKIYVSAQNFITLTNYSWWDPEVNSRGADAPQGEDTRQGIDHYSYPIPKSLTVGFRLGF